MQTIVNPPYFLMPTTPILDWAEDVPPVSQENHTQAEQPIQHLNRSPQLPKHLWTYLFSFVPEDAQLQAREACKVFYAAIDELHKQHGKVRRRTMECASGLVALEMNRKVSSLHTLWLIEGCSARDMKNIEMSHYASTLQRLCLTRQRRIRMGDTIMPKILTLAKLTTLEISCYSLKIEDLSLSISLRSLSFFDCSFYSKNGSGFFKTLSRMTKLRNLYLKNVEKNRKPLKIDQAMIQTLKPLEHLESITAQFSRKAKNLYPDISLMLIRAFPALKSISSSDRYNSLEPYNGLQTKNVTASEKKRLLSIDLCGQGSIITRLSRDILQGILSPFMRQELLQLLTKETIDPEQMGSVLFSAIDALDDAMLKHLLDIGVDKDAKNKEGTTALQHVTYNMCHDPIDDRRIEYRSMFLHLLEAGANPNIASRDRSLPLFELILHDPSSVIELLNAKVPANPNLETTTPQLKLSVALGAACEFSTYSPLQVAISRWVSNPEDEKLAAVVKLLIEKKANVNVRSRTGMTILDYLWWTRNNVSYEKLLHSLIEMGAINIKSSPEDVKGTLAQSQDDLQELLQFYES